MKGFPVKTKLIYKQSNSGAFNDFTMAYVLVELPGNDRVRLYDIQFGKISYTLSNDITIYPIVTWLLN